MDDVQLYAEAVDWLGLVLSVALVVLPTLLVLALVFLGGAGAVNSGRKLWESLRPAVDEPTDPLIQMIAAALKTRPELVSDFIVGLLDATFEPSGAVPLGEVLVGGGAGFTGEEIDRLRALAADPALFHQRPIGEGWQATFAYAPPETPDVAPDEYAPPQEHLSETTENVEHTEENQP